MPIRMWVHCALDMYTHRELRLLISRSSGGDRDRIETLRRVGDTFVWQQAELYSPDRGDDGIVMERECGQNLINCLWGLGFRPRDAEATSGYVAALQSEIRFLRKQLKRAGEPFGKLADLHSKLMDIQPASSDGESLGAIEEKLTGLELQLRDYAERNVRRGDNLNESLGYINESLSIINAFNVDARKAFLDSSRRGETIVDQIRDINRRHENLVKLTTDILEKGAIDVSGEEDPASPGREVDQGGDGGRADHPPAE